MNKKYKYRFKTEKECIDELIKEGRNVDDWRLILGFNSHGEMDYLLNTEVIVPDHLIDEDGEFSNNFDLFRPDETGNDYDGWIISPKMIIKEPLKLIPQYKPKKFIYE